MCRELARLYRRGIWIAQIIQEDDLDSVDDIAQTVHDASPTKLYAKERIQFDTHPHFAAYWLLAHAFLGRTDSLADALERTQKTKNPTLIDLRKKLTPFVKDPSRLDKFLAKHRNWTKEEIAEIRSWGSAKRLK